jgi:hypothetical protein
MSSLYGKGLWGTGVYSASPELAGDLAPSVTFGPSALRKLVGLAGALTPTATLGGALTASEALTGNLVPVVTFGPSVLTTPQNINGDLAPSVTLAANLSLTYAVAGNLAPQAALGASLTGDWTIAGDMPPGLDFAAEIVAGPLWATDTLCPPPLWTSSTLCPAPPWRPETNWRPSLYGVGGYGLNLFGFGFPVQNYAPSVYGVGAYGAAGYGLGQATPFVPVWTPSELCHA